MAKTAFITVAISGFLLAACGDTTGEQAILGGAAGVGTAVLINSNPVTGAVLGGAANVAYCKLNPGKCS